MPPTTRRSPRAAAKPPAKPQRGLFERLRAEAMQEVPEIEPYVISDVEPPIVIEAPDTAEQQLALLAMFDNEGSFQLADAKAVLATVCGDAFPRVWELCRHEKLPVLLALIKEMGEHFQEQGALVGGVEEDDFPGGS
jgi:hypothetical protein